MTVWYNENDLKAAAWLRELIDAGHIAPGVVDERSIVDVKATELAGFTQCHFFAGIGGWSHALRLAGWPDDRPVWTGSCPCQPFSAAGKRLGITDDRHLAPTWLNLIDQCRPASVFGEQVATAVTKDRWLDTLFDALEGAGYACGAAVVPACGVGAPHIRQRLWFVARRVADGKSSRYAAQSAERRQQFTTRASNALAPSCWPSRVADSDDTGPQGRGGMPERAGECVTRAGSVGRSTNTPDDPWSIADWLYCRDGKWRPVEPGTFPLAHGIPGRVGLLRGYGNAIVPQVAAEIVKCVM